MAHTTQDSDDEQAEPRSDSSRASRTDPAPKDPKKIIEQAKKRFKLCDEAEGDNRKLAREDYEFRSGKQWKDQDVTDRAVDGRPCLVINRIPQFIHQITNDQRQNRPSIKVHPTGSGAKEETSEIIQGLVRHIEYRSSADTAYDTALDGAATGGFGYFRILTEYEGHKSFDLELRIKRLRNPFAAFLDPSHQEPDGSDANYGFTWDDLQEDEYRAQYPDSELARSHDWDSLSAQAPDWLKGDSARVLEYFDRVMVPDTLLQLSDGTTVLESEYEPPEPAQVAPPAPQPGMPAQPMMPPAPHVIGKRATKVPKVYWYKINGIEILDETEWVSKWVPIIPVYGDEFIDPNSGKVIREGIVRHSKDSQRMYNFWASSEAETIALAPRAPFIGADGQFEGHEEQWKTANRRNHAFLEYKPTSVNGQLAPPPQRQAFEPPIQAITQAKMMTADDMKATTGIYDASLGRQSNETSGVAIQRRNTQSQVANFHIGDNLSKSIRHAGRILVDAIPKVYDRPRTVRIIGDEGDQRIVQLNQPFNDKGKQALYDVTVGEYDVAIDVGPSYATKRQEAVASMMDLTKSYPPLMQAAGDLVVQNMDWPGAKTIADRIKKTLPPGLADDDNGQQAPVPPHVQMQMQQMGQMIDQLTKETHTLSHALEIKKPELESKERIEMAKLQAEVEIAMAKMGSQESIALLEQQIAGIQHRMSLIGFDQPINEDSDLEAAGGQSAAQAPGQPPTGGESPGTPGAQPPGPSMGQ